MAFAFISGFLLGAVSVLALDALVIYWIFRGLRGNRVALQGVNHETDALLGHCAPNDGPYEKQGVVWVLDQDKLPRSSSDPHIKETKGPKKEIIETSPVKKNAKIKDHNLVLTDGDGSQTWIPLLDCNILAISSSNLSSNKWFKRYPVVIESNDTIIYDRWKTCYLYFETSWEKESWCRALRLASNSDEAKLASYAELQVGFKSYLRSLAVEYPLFQKSSKTPSESPKILSVSADKSIKTDEPSSKFSHFFRKLAKKARIGGDNKSSAESLSAQTHKKIGDKLRNPQDAPPSTSGSIRSTASEKSSLGVPAQPVSSIPVSDPPPDVNVSLDEGTFCLNMLLARLFFDVKRNTELNNLITTRLQKTLSNMKTPSYMGGITCTGLDMGILPPYIHQVRSLPVDMKEVCALEVDVEYRGGFTVEIETRLDVREPEFQGIVTNLGQNSAENTTSDLLEDFESYSNQLNFKTTSLRNDEHDGCKSEGLRTSKSSSWASTYKTRWKNIVNSIAEHVSQVPIALVIKVSILRGTLCLRIKPPPSDRLWYGFTSMPEIDFSLDSSFGDHKISSSHIGQIIANRLKMGVRDSIVFPNCEGIYIPWMFAEKDDWLSRSAAPYMWRRHENNELPRKVAANSQVTVESKNVSDRTMKSDSSKETVSSSRDMVSNDEKKRSSGDHFPPPPAYEPVLNPAGPELPSASFSSDESCSKDAEDLRVPLLENCDDHVTSAKKGYDDPVTRNLVVAEPTEDSPILSSVATKPTFPTQDDHHKPRRIWSRPKMSDLGKKVGEKFEEKKRNIEEKGRSMVEKFKESSRTSFDSSILGAASSSFR